MPERAHVAAVYWILQIFGSGTPDWTNPAFFPFSPCFRPQLPAKSFSFFRKNQQPFIAACHGNVSSGLLTVQVILQRTSPLAQPLCCPVASVQIDVVQSHPVGPTNKLKANSTFPGPLPHPRMSSVCPPLKTGDRRSVSFRLPLAYSRRNYRCWLVPNNSENLQALACDSGSITAMATTTKCVKRCAAIVVLILTHSQTRTSLSTARL